MLRTSSWLVGAASLALPAAYYLHQLDTFHTRAQAQDGITCGMPMLAAVIVSIFASAVLSAVGTLLNGLHLRRQRDIRSKARYAELLALSLPLLAGITVVCVAIVKK